MRIYSMQATFGKLQGETITLKPGLNVITAHNEWGKSTWCAFLAAMLYGMDTRAKSTKHALADKERYAPWSGSPMSGRIDLNWNGRDITIQRETRGRTPMGHFRAYETASGLDIPELTAENCGKLLLGVEKSVFMRSAFVRFSDLPVSDDETLRQRLNDLVTTGEETGAAHRLDRELKELSNRIRYNRSGLLPQAEAERDALTDAIGQRAYLLEQTETCQQRMDQVRDWQMLLENHRTAVAYAAYQADEARVRTAEEAAEAAQEEALAAQQRCGNYPDRESISQMLGIIAHMQQSRWELEEDLRLLVQPEPLEGPETPFDGMCPEDALAIVEADAEEYLALTRKRYWLTLCGLAMVILGGTLLIWETILGSVCMGFGIFALLLDGLLRGRRKNRAKLLRQQYSGGDVEQWRELARNYAARQRSQDDQWEDYYAQRQRLRQELENLLRDIEEATKGDGLEATRAAWEQALQDMDRADRLEEDARRVREHAASLRAMLRPVPKPEITDRMDYSGEETSRLLAECAEEYRRLESRMHQHRGKLEALGDGGELLRRKETLDQRIARLELHRDALELARNTLAEARLELQRRFAPQIARRAQALMARMTDGRYERVRLSQDMTLQAGGVGEDILRQILWRSDGTMDQLYLALRLAVAEALAPEAPLILDDALVRFDDTRLKATLGILKEEAGEKQILLFTCHGREAAAMEDISGK